MLSHPPSYIYTLYSLFVYSLHSLSSAIIYSLQFVHTLPYSTSLSYKSVPLHPLFHRMFTLSSPPFPFLGPPFSLSLSISAHISSYYPFSLLHCPGYAPLYPLSPPLSPSLSCSPGIVIMHMESYSHLTLHIFSSLYSYYAHINHIHVSRHSFSLSFPPPSLSLLLQGILQSSNLCIYTDDSHSLLHLYIILYAYLSLKTKQSPLSLLPNTSSLGLFPLSPSCLCY